MSLLHNVTPNGLKLKKSPQIGRTSEEFSRNWKQIIHTAETDLIRTLIKEYKVAERSFQVDFWNTMITYLSQERDLHSVIGTITEIHQNILSISEASKVTRVRKMNGLTEGNYNVDLENAYIEQFNFQSDLASLKDEFDEMLEGTTENPTIDLAEINRILVAGEQDTISNEALLNTVPVQTVGEASNSEYSGSDIEEQLMDEGPLNIAHDDIHSDRISGQFVNDKVINLSNRALSDSKISVLSKGLKFVATPKELDYSQIKIEMENFGRRLRLKWHFRESEEFSEYPVFRPKSKFNPRNKDIAIEVYLSKLEEEIMKVTANGNNFSNISREERAALNGLKQGAKHGRGIAH